MAETEQSGNQSSSRSILSRPAPAADYRFTYGSASPQFGDLRLPKGPGPFAVVVVIHGGCWRAEYDLEYMGHVCADLTAAGVATWNIEYRRLDQEGGGWPGTYLDVAGAIDHLRVLAREHPLDLKRVVVTGHSAGGHLTLWAAGRHRLPQNSSLSRPDPLPLAGAVPIAGLTDLSRAGTACDDQSPLMRGPQDALSETSPIEMLPLGLPVTIIQGEADEAVPPIQATTYVEAAVRAGDHPKLVLFHDADHFVVIDPHSNVWARVRSEILALAGKP